MNRTIKKILVATGCLLSLCTIVLAWHVYGAKHRHHYDTRTRIMARVDFKQAIGQDDAGKIYSWLMQQKGIERVACNGDNRTVVFTYSPRVVNADELVRQLQASLHYEAERYMPGKAEMSSGCPAM